MGISKMIGVQEINALVISPDTEVSGIFSQLFQQIGVTTQTCMDESLAPNVLSTSKFEALVLDFDNVSAGVPLIDKLRANPSSRNAIVFAVATQVSSRHTALAHGVNFAFERPLFASRIRQALETAYALMLHDRRRYFRCPLETPVQITTASGEKLSGTTMNVSSNGMAIIHPSVFQVGQQLALDLRIEAADLTLNVSGTVVWDDRHGKAGISFECGPPDKRKQLAAWLDAQFYRPLKSSGSQSV